MNEQIKRISAGAVVLRHEKNQWYALILRSWNHWDFPKGAVEAGESLLQTSLREVFEETGINDLSFPWGQDFVRTPIYSKDKVAFYTVAQTSTVHISMEPNPSSGLIEHEEYKWVPWTELAYYLTPRLNEVLNWVSKIVNLPELHLQFNNLWKQNQPYPVGHFNPTKALYPNSTNLSETKKTINENNFFEKKAKPPYKSTRRLKKQLKKQSHKLFK